jgi:hypothetical protein
MTNPFVQVELQTTDPEKAKALSGAARGLRKNA